MPTESPRPTDAELAILRVLWDRGPSTVREVHDALNEQRKMGYTTVLKFMQIMHDKRLLERDESQRSHVYRAKPSQQSTQKQLVKDLLDRAFGGSAKQLVMHALSAARTSPKELQEIRKLIDEANGTSTKRGPQ
jgi:predicted transcriptional regulator